MYWERRIRNSDTSIESGNWVEDKKINLNKWKIMNYKRKIIGKVFLFRKKEILPHITTHTKKNSKSNEVLYIKIFLTDT